MKPRLEDKQLWKPRSFQNHQHTILQDTSYEEVDCLSLSLPLAFPASLPTFLGPTHFWSLQFSPDLSLTFFHLPPTSMGTMATNGDTSRLPCKTVVTTFLLLLFIYTLTHFSRILSSGITPTGLLHLSPFLSFPSMILSSFYIAYSSWITMKMNASRYCEILVPVYQYASHHISNRKTFISTTIRTSKSWKAMYFYRSIFSLSCKFWCTTL